MKKNSLSILTISGSNYNAIKTRINKKSISKIRSGCLTKYRYLTKHYSVNIKRYFFLILFCFSNSIAFSQNAKYKSPENYLNRIIVDISNFDFKKDAKFDHGNWLSSWTCFPVNKKQFDSISPIKPEENWSLFKKKMIEICKIKKLDSISLSKCLDFIKSRNAKIALLPIAVYSAKLEKKNVWVIMCIWEFESALPDIYYVENLQTYGHSRNWAIIPDNLEIIAYWTCE